MRRPRLADIAATSTGVCLLLWAVLLAAQPRFEAVWGAPGSGVGEFRAPTGMAVNAGDTLYVADAFFDRITLFAPTGVVLAAWDLAGSAPGRLRHPEGIAVDADGDLYIADSGNHRVQRLTRDGRFVAVLGDSGSAPGQFRGPSGLTLTRDRRLYVADYGNARVQEFDWSQSPPRFVGILGGASAALVGPTDVAVDSFGSVFVADLLGREIVQFTRAGDEVRRFSGTGLPPEPPAPLGVLVDGATLHVTDVLNGFVEAFDTNGQWLYAWPPNGLPGPARLAAGRGRRLFVGSAQDRVIFVFQRPVPVQAQPWSGIKQRFR